MNRQFSVEWKARNYKDKHAWILDNKTKMEAPLCDPTRQISYINPYLREGFLGGKPCKKCLLKIAAFKEKFPLIKVEFAP